MENLIKNNIPASANQLWVADITYIALASGDVCYRHLITDAYSHMIYSTELHRQEAVRHSFRKDLNVEVVGYPDADLFLNYQPSDEVVWKKQDHPKKRLIWAPHCAIPSYHRKNVATVSNFLWMADLMLSMAEKYKEVLQIAFKPHPFLISRLYGYAGWGKERTKAKSKSIWNN